MLACAEYASKTSVSESLVEPGNKTNQTNKQSLHNTIPHSAAVRRQTGFIDHVLCKQNVQQSLGWRFFVCLFVCLTFVRATG